MKILNITKKIRLLLIRKDKVIFITLVALSLLLSLIEIIGITAIFPLISIINDFSYIDNNKYMSYLYELFDFKSEIRFLTFFSILLMGYYLFRALYLIFHKYLETSGFRIIHNRIIEKQFDTLSNIYYQDFVKNNLAYMLDSMSRCSSIIGILSNIQAFITKIIIILSIFSLMIYVSWQITLFIIVIGVIFYLLSKYITKKNLKYSTISAFAEREISNISLTYFNNFKISKFSSQKKLRETLSINLIKIKKVISKQAILMFSPRLILETLGFFILLTILVFFLWKSHGNIREALPILSIYALALYRVLPLVNELFINYQNFVGNSVSFDMVIKYFDMPYEKLGSTDITFTKNIELKNINFYYDKNTPILNNINLVINRGQKIGFQGKSGIGKSTLVDIIVSCIYPTSGQILVDNVVLSKENIKQWRYKIGYVTQHVYLFDGTVADNVYFYRNRDEKKLIEVLKKVQIYDFLVQKQGINTKVGDGGVMLSGGQKQRIAIARALYNDPEIIVLDEATSALDTNTEAKVMENIYNITKDKTVFIIAHRLSTLEKCDTIYSLENSNLILVK